jgi:hypothetical protein
VSISAIEMFGAAPRRPLRIALCAIHAGGQ